MKVSKGRAVNVKSAIYRLAASIYTEILLHIRRPIVVHKC